MTNDLDFMAELDAEVAAEKRERKSQPRAAYKAAPLFALPADLDSPDSGWHSTALILQYSHQHCRCCNGTTTALVGEFVQWERNGRDGLHSKVWRPRPAPAGKWLPYLIDEFHTTVGLCFACVQGSEIVNDFLAPRAEQLKLFN